LKEPEGYQVYAHFVSTYDVISSVKTASVMRHDSWISFTTVQFQLFVLHICTCVGKICQVINTVAQGVLGRNWSLVVTLGWWAVCLLCLVFSFLPKCFKIMLMQHGMVVVVLY